MLENFKELYDILRKSQDAIGDGIENGLATASVRVMGAAKAKLGTYQPAVGPYPAWVKLKPRFVRAKHMRKSETNNAENALYVIQKGKYKGDIRFRRHLTKSGKEYLKEHGSWGNGGNDDAPLFDTGHLKAAITNDTKDINKGIVYVGVAAGQKDNKGSSPGEYAAAHEFGYSKKDELGKEKIIIPARPYLRPAVYENKEAILEDIGEAIKEELEKLWQK